MSSPDSPGGARRAQFETAASWAVDVNGALRASRRLAWTVAAVAVGIAGLEALALVALAPLKTVVPYTILVDRQTGYVETIKGLKPGPLSETAAVTQAFLVQYVIARETFDATDLREAYRKITLWSAGAARSGYQREMQKTNPSSPLNLYTASTVVRTTIKNVWPIKEPVSSSSPVLRAFPNMPDRILPQRFFGDGLLDDVEHTVRPAFAPDVISHVHLRPSPKAFVVGSTFTNFAR